MTPERQILIDLIASSAVPASGGDRERDDGALVVVGQRPGADWHGHGYFTRRLWVLRDGELRRVSLAKHRWRHKVTGKTCHSRSMEEQGSVGSAVLIVVLMLWSWLDGAQGLHHRDRREVIESLEGSASSRTLQRWLSRWLCQAMEIQQAIRRAVIERCEPRPVETLFEGGLPPPQGLVRRRWKNPPLVQRLWRALAILFGGAVALDVPITLLLAEARGRWSDQRSPAF